MTIQEYARAVAEEVWHHARTFEVPDPPLWEELDAIIASVPPPTAQHHAAPTCVWTEDAEGESWSTGCGETWTLLDGSPAENGVRFCFGCGRPLLPPDTTEPASVLLCEKVPHEQRGGYLHAEDDDTPYYVDGLRYCGRCHHFLDEGESHRAAPAPVAPPTPDIDPEEVRRALDAFEREWGSPGGVAAQDGLTLMAAAREYLRLREQPAPDVQAVKLCNCGKCFPGPLYSQHERDAAVAREREEVQAHAPLYLEWVKEGALSADDALERLVIWLRARSAKGV